MYPPTGLTAGPTKLWTLVALLATAPFHAALGDEAPGTVYDVTTELVPVGETRVNRSEPACSLDQPPPDDAPFCQPDPSAGICERRTPEERARALARAQKIKEAIAAATPLWSNLLPDVAQRSLAGKRLLETPLFQEKPRIEARIRMLLAAYERLMQDRKILKPASRAAISRMLAGCANGFRIVVIPSGSHNAAVGTIDRLLPGELDALTGDSDDPYAAVAAHECTISLSPRTWVECSQGSPACDIVIAHELGHLLNSCGYIRSGLTLQQSRSEGQESLLRNHRSAFLKRLGIGASEMLGLGRDLMTSTECLSVISDPRESIPNSCSDRSKSTEEFEARCGLNQSTRYPTQWSEAEADAWAASAYATFLKTIPSLTERRRLIREALLVGCELAEQENSHATDIPKLNPLDCHDQVASGAPSPGEARWPQHQPWLHRQNRNFLRNADLREALGCKVDGAVPVACAPGRALYFVMPQ